jgi:hypothetical protein
MKKINLLIAISTCCYLLSLQNVSSANSHLEQPEKKFTTPDSSRLCVSPGEPTEQRDGKLKLNLGDYYSWNFILEVEGSDKKYFVNKRLIELELPVGTSIIKITSGIQRFSFPCTLSYDQVRTGRFEFSANEKVIRIDDEKIPLKFFVKTGF